MNILMQIWMHLVESVRLRMQKDYTLTSFVSTLKKMDTIRQKYVKKFPTSIGQYHFSVIIVSYKTFRIPRFPITPLMIYISCFSWYPVILSISTLFLLATLVIFSLKHVVLINNYTSIVWHFVLCMFIAFIILIFNQSTEIKPVSEPLCVAVGMLIVVSKLDL